MFSASQHPNPSNPEGSDARVALVLSGGAARGLAHIGILQVLEREGIPLASIVGTSMGGLIGALSARGLDSHEVADVARGFRFPHWYIPGLMVRWNSIFASAVPVLSGTFEELATPLVVTAVDVESGAQVLLRTGPILPAVQATCTVPGILPPVRIDDHWLVDGGLVNVLPVDVAWAGNPDIVVAVKVGATGKREIPQLNGRLTAVLSRLGSVLPNPATAKVTAELLFRSVEIMLDRQTTLAVAMTGPELLIEPELGDMGLRDFNRIEHAIDAGRQAAEATLPELSRLLEQVPSGPRAGDRIVNLRFDPVCAMVINPRRARASATCGDKTYYFCSENCRDQFEHDPSSYLERVPYPSSP